jgi:serine/threonine protein kinase, bacterial
LPQLDYPKPRPDLPVSRIRLEAGSVPFPGLKLIQLRGRGGFAEVWEAEDPNGERIAVKFMLSRNSTSSVKEMRILQAVQKLTHRHLLRIRDVWSIPDYIVVAMELADGSLFDLFDVYQTEYGTSLPPSLLAGYLRQAASGLDFLNARRHIFDGRPVGFMHCDVKPSNILLVGEVIKLADFGLSTPMVALQSTYGRAGTPDFAAPEVHRGHLSISSDQYSLAVSYYLLRTGYFPFPPPPGDFKRSYSYHRPSPDLTRVSRGERRVLERALELEPAGRYPSCTAFMNALTDALNGPDGATMDTSTEVRVPTIILRASHHG